MAVFALVDCNNFYASCEKLFDPRLKGRPVVVLSNNDGCVIARSAEAKALGIPMGAPWFKIAADAQRQGVIPFSSNYALYADMSNRVVEVLGQFTPALEVYSIDESFLELSGFMHQPGGLPAYGAQIRQRVADWLGLAVCVGIGPTKTLAKLANHCAKKGLAGRDGVCDWTALPPPNADDLCGQIAAGEIWGVGRKLSGRLAEMGIQTVRDLRQADPGLIRRRFSVVLERTVRELRGESCLDLEEVVPDRQQIMCSRSFGRTIEECDELEEAVASYIARAAEKLRAQELHAGAVQVFLLTNRFRPELPQYHPAMMVPLPHPTDDTRCLLTWALRLLRRIYRPGFAYIKAGVMLMNLAPKSVRQGSLFAPVADETQSAALMHALDRINDRYGRGTLRLAAEGMERHWQMRRERLSPSYTTRWDSLPPVLAR